MKHYFFALFIVLFISCNSGNDSETNNTNNSYEKTKMSLEEKEKGMPTSFLKASFTYRQNLIDQWVLEGKISNTATVATYKDVTLNILYFSKTDTEIGSEEKTIFEFFRPGSSQDFKIKTNGYVGTASIKMQIVSANVVD